MVKLSNTIVYYIVTCVYLKSSLKESKFLCFVNYTQANFQTNTKVYCYIFASHLLYILNLSGLALQNILNNYKISFKLE